MSGKVCSVCRRQESVVFCRCQNTETFLCSQHISKHCENWDALHDLLSIKAYPEHTSPGYLERLKIRQRALEAGKTELQRSLNTIDRCIQELALKIESIVFSLFEYGHLSRKRLIELKVNLETRINEAVAEAEDTLYQDNPLFQNFIVDALRTFVPGSETLALFDYRLLQNPFPQKVEDLLSIKLVASDGTVKEEQIQSKLLSKGSIQRKSSLSVERLVAVFPDSLRWFNPTNNRWDHNITLKQVINVDQNSSSVHIDAGNVFICGGGSLESPCIFYIDNTTYIVDPFGNAKQLSYMVTGNRFFGLIYSEKVNLVCLFGGESGGEEYTVHRRSTSEAFSLSKLQWFRLPSMKQARSSFNPCSHLDLVYLCGGGPRTVEVYNPLTNTLKELSGCSLYEGNSACVSVIESDCIVAISPRTCSRWNLRSQVSGVEHHSYVNELFSQCAPVTVGGVIYVLVNNHLCKAFDLTNGELTKEYELPAA